MKLWCGNCWGKEEIRQQSNTENQIVEKTANMGGNTALAGGALNAVDEGSEEALAREDSVDFHYQQN